MIIMIIKCVFSTPYQNFPKLTGSRKIQKFALFNFAAKMSIILPNGNGFWRKGFLGNDGNTTKGESCFGNRKSSRSLLNTHNLDTVVSERGMFSICRNIFSIISPSDPAAHPVFCQVFYFWREKTFLGLLFHLISFSSTGWC